ncbi:MAG: A/G-specific adenine glycosylase [Opitutaceae bacterium]|nr:A/G-specific adenine glycosylase [Opitutaceae bacterium]
MPPPTQPPFDAARFSRDLLGWYDSHRRSLPWRERPSTYATVVSEFMLQQTQIKTALPYFDRWMVRFPSFSALAATSEEEVVKAWEGLGYYTRARNLRRLAIEVAAQGEPRDAAGWSNLPGIGPYTAAAIASIAFGERIACVDGNVVRILTRLTADGTSYPDSSRAAKAFTALANSLVPEQRPGDHNQAMMELGATVCHRHSPLCTVCPVLSYCAAGKSGDPGSYPRLAAKNYEKKTVDRLLVIQDGRILLHRAHTHAKRLADLHELPDFVAVGLTEPSPGLKLIATRKRAITRWQISERIWRATVADIRSEGLHWVELNQLDQITLSGPHRRWLSELLVEELALK